MTFSWIEQLPAPLQRLLSTSDFRNRLSQAHSRSIVQRLRVTSELWPRYDPELDEKLHYTAHYLYSYGIQLKLSNTQSVASDEIIKMGSEILEYLYAYSDGFQIEKTRQLFNAALGYYISGYYARSYVLMKDISADISLPQELELLRRLFLKNFDGVRLLTFELLSSNDYRDSSIAAGLRQAVVSEDEAISRVLHANLNNAFSYFIEYPKTGRRSFIDRAVQLADRGIQLSLKTNFVDWWWLFVCASLMFREYDNNSLWTQLRPLIDDDEGGQVVEPYIRANYRREAPITELWRSQVTALPYINEPERRSYCLKMPTSAGKTGVAELAILRFLLDNKDDPNTKCIYIAPFRSLAAEIEQRLQQSFHPLGTRVSELYGGFELSPTDRLMMEQTRIIVATPEKIDALLRYNPDFGDEIKLVIVDEGHIISYTERGLRFEMFIHRLVRRFAAKNTRILFISAVLPNTEDFAQWITGDATQVIQTQWRPSRQLLGELIWDGRNARIEYLESDHAKLLHECFVPNFIASIDPKPIPRVRRRKIFPDDFQEVVAEAAVLFALQGMTMVFCARKGSVNPLARKVVESIGLHKAKAAQKGEVFSLPIKDHGRLSVCILLAIEVMGADHEVIDFLRAGVVVHHASIPKQLRIRFEEIVRDGVVPLVIASTTLAQGVNLPIQTVIVHGLSHGYDQDLTPITFWNICGRAGRGMMENEGQILFAVDIHKPDLKLNNTTFLTPYEIERRTRFKREQTIKEESLERKNIIKGYRAYQLQSALLQLLEMIANQWRITHPGVNIAELYLQIAENNVNWIEEEDRLKVERLLVTLDSELLALTEEAELTEYSPDLLQGILQNCLASLQAGKLTNAQERIETMKQVMFARLRYIHNKVRSPLQRRRFYQIGLPISDCEEIERHQDALLALYMQAANYEAWDSDARCLHLLKVAEFLLSLNELQPRHLESMNEDRVRILYLWLQGYTPQEMAEDFASGGKRLRADNISSYVDQVFDYKLPWGFNALGIYLNSLAEERAASISPITSYFPSLIKYGIHDVVASALLTFGLRSRKLALKVATNYRHDVESISDVLFWFLKLKRTELVLMGLNDRQIEAFLVAQKNAGIQTGNDTRTKYVLRLNFPPATTLPSLEVGDSLFMQVTREEVTTSFSVHTLSGVTLGTFQTKESIPMSWQNPENIEVNIDNIQQFEGGQLEFRVTVTEV